MKKLKAAVVGTGSFGRLHAMAYVEHPMVDLVAVVNRTEETGRKVAEEFGVNFYATSEELLEKEEFDIVSVCTAEQAHKEAGILFAKAGKKILMEKPLAPTLAEVDELIAGVEKHNGYMKVNYILRYDPRFLKVREMVDAGELGDPITCFVRRRGTFAGAQHYGPWSDILISTAIHDLDLMIWLNDSDPVRVHGESIIRKCASIGENGTEDAFVATVKFESGAIGCLETNWVLPQTVPCGLDPAFHLIGTKGGVFVEGGNSGMRVVTEEAYSHPDLVHWPQIKGLGLHGDLKNSIDEFVEGVLAGRKPSMTGHDARKSTAVVFAIQESAKTGKPVYL